MEFSSENYNTLLKIVVVGDSDVGKTTLLGRLASGAFRANLTSTVGIDYMTHTVAARGKSVKLQIWDTAGQERYRALTNAYFRGASGAVLMYDITNKRSFDDVQEWMLNMSFHGSSKIKAVLVGHKSDLEDLRVITAQEGQLLASTCNIPFFEASSKTGSNCVQIFNKLTETILDDETSCNVSTSVPLSSEDRVTNKSRCC